MENNKIKKITIEIEYDSETNNLKTHIVNKKDENGITDVLLCNIIGVLKESLTAQIVKQACNDLGIYHESGKVLSPEEIKEINDYVDSMKEMNINIIE